MKLRLGYCELQKLVSAMDDNHSINIHREFDLYKYNIQPKKFDISYETHTGGGRLVAQIRCTCSKASWRSLWPTSTVFRDDPGEWGICLSTKTRWNRYMYMYMYVYTHVYIITITYIYTYTHTLIHIHVYMYAYVHIYIYMYIYIL